MVSVGQRTVRGFLIGIGLALLSALGIFYMTEGFNILADGSRDVISSIGLALMVFGGITTLGIAIGLSDDIAEQLKEERTKPTGT